MTRTRGLVLGLIVAILIVGGWLLWSGKLGIDISQYFAYETPGYVPPQSLVVDCDIRSGVNRLVWGYHPNTDRNSLQRGSDEPQLLSECADYWCWLPGENYQHESPAPGEPATYLDRNTDGRTRRDSGKQCFEYRVKYGVTEVSNSVFCPTGCNYGDGEVLWDAEPTQDIERGGAYEFEGDIVSGMTNAPIELFVARPDGTMLIDGFLLSERTDDQGFFAGAEFMGLTDEGQVGTYESWVTVGGVESNRVLHEVIHERSGPPTGTLRVYPEHQYIALGNAHILRATGGTGSYEWSAPNSNPDNGTGETFQVFYSAVGRYQVTVRSGAEIVSADVSIVDGSCGDEACNHGETCSTCSYDCGTCLSGGTVFVNPSVITDTLILPPGKDYDISFGGEFGSYKVTALELYLSVSGGEILDFTPSIYHFTEILDIRRDTPSSWHVTVGARADSGGFGPLADVGTMRIHVSDKLQPGRDSFAVSVLPPSRASYAGSNTALRVDENRVEWDVSVSAVPGDADGDGDVDIFDYNLVISNFGTTGPEGDLDGDGDVDIFDYNLVISNFGG